MVHIPQYYVPPQDPTLWSGRKDAAAHEYLFQMIQFLDLNHLKVQHIQLPAFALLGFESDVGVKRNLGRPGACNGPRAFRQVAGGLAMQQALHIYDAGNVCCIDDDLEAAQAMLGQQVAKLLHYNLKPIVIGGGHETAWGHFQGLMQHYRQQEIAILNFDAHFDIRPLIDQRWGSSGTAFRQIADDLKKQNRSCHYYCAGIQPFANTHQLFADATKMQIQYLLAETIQQQPNDLSFITDIIQKHQHIYVSICLDVFNAAIAPGVSAPQPLGIQAEYVLTALRLLRRSNKVISLDIVELAPNHDIQQHTAKLAALLLMQYLHG